MLPFRCGVGTGGTSAKVSGLTLKALLASCLTLAAPTWKPSSPSESEPESESPHLSGTTRDVDSRRPTSDGFALPRLPLGTTDAEGKSALFSGLTLKLELTRLSVPTWKQSSASESESE
jgi:hypothetical protein